MRVPIYFSCTARHACGIFLGILEANLCQDCHVVGSGGLLAKAYKGRVRLAESKRHVRLCSCQRLLLGGFLGFPKIHVLLLSLTLPLAQQCKFIESVASTLQHSKHPPSFKPRFLCTHGLPLLTTFFWTQLVLLTARETLKSEFSVLVVTGKWHGFVLWTKQQL